MTTALLADLRRVVGDRHVIDDPGVAAPYETDWTRRYRGRALAVVRPGTTDEVANVVGLCAAAGVGITPQGGNTGLVGGGIPRDGDVVISTRRFDGLKPVDIDALQVSAGAGVSVARLQAHARAAGLDFGIDLAARDSATVGGLAATNAGGIRVVRHGPMRAQVVGLEAVLGDGSIISRMAGLTKDSTGYDLTSLLVGSEGTLGIITALRLRLVPALGRRATALVAVAGAGEALAVLAAVRPLGTLAAAEIFFRSGLDIVRAHTSLPLPLAEDHPAYVLLEVAAASDPSDALIGCLAGCPEVRDATVELDVNGQRALWRYREAHTESISAQGIPLKLDVSVPLRHFTAMLEELPGAVGAVCPAARLVLFGHVNEGNIHVNVLGVEERGKEVSDAVLRVIARLEGSISAEHGIGRAKAPWLQLTRSHAEIAAMRAVKQALDPHGILNPDALFG